MTAARRRSTILPRIVQGRGVRWQGAGVVSRRVRIDTGAQLTRRDNEKREPKVLTVDVKANVLLALCVLPSHEPGIRCQLERNATIDKRGLTVSDTAMVGLKL